MIGKQEVNFDEYFLKVYKSVSSFLKLNNVGFYFVKHTNCFNF